MARVNSWWRAASAPRSRTCIWLSTRRSTRASVKAASLPGGRGPSAFRCRVQANQDECLAQGSPRLPDGRAVSADPGSSGNCTGSRRSGGPQHAARPKPRRAAPGAGKRGATGPAAPHRNQPGQLEPERLARLVPAAQGEGDPPRRLPRPGEPCEQLRLGRQGQRDRSAPPSEAGGDLAPRQLGPCLLRLRRGRRCSTLRSWTRSLGRAEGDGRQGPRRRPASSARQ